MSGISLQNTRGNNYYDDIILGQFSNAVHVNKFARRETNQAAGGDQTLWESNTNFTVNETPNSLSITYNNATDGLGSTGALAILISYLNSSFKLVEATHVLGGTGTDTTSFSDCLGINRARVVSTGVADVNTNAITLTDSGAAGIQAYIPADDSVTHQSMFHVPIGGKFIMKAFKANANKISGGSSPRVVFKMKSYSRALQTLFTLITFTIDTAIENTVEREFPTGFEFDGRDVVFWTIDTDNDDTPTTMSYEATLYSDGRPARDV